MNETTIRIEMAEIKKDNEYIKKSVDDLNKKMDEFIKSMNDFKENIPNVYATNKRVEKIESKLSEHKKESSSWVKKSIDVGIAIGGWILLVVVEVMRFFQVR